MESNNTNQSKEKKFDLRAGFLVLMVLLAAMSRLLPHPPNVAPLGAMALFGAAYFSNRTVSVVIPLLAIWLSNLVLDNVVYAQYYSSFQWFSPDFIWQALAMISIVGLGWIALRKVGPMRLLGASLGASLLFFLISNLGVWASGTLYPTTSAGLASAYFNAIPFFWNTLAGDLFFTALLFGVFEIAQRRFPSLQPFASRP